MIPVIDCYWVDSCTPKMLGAAPRMGEEQAQATSKTFKKPTPLKPKSEASKV